MKKFADWTELLVSVVPSLCCSICGFEMATSFVNDSCMPFEKGWSWAICRL